MYKKSYHFTEAALYGFHHPLFCQNWQLLTPVDLMGRSWNQFVVKCLQWKKLGMALAANGTAINEVS